jgi:SAM-dependent methyltransferase
MSKQENVDVFNTTKLVQSYNADGGLTPAEIQLFDLWIKDGSSILDLGVGTGRTYPALAKRGSRYIGIDYSEAMVQASKSRFPEGDFRVADASDLSAFQDASFDVIVFSYNGIDYLHPYALREKAFSEIKRLLKPGGVLIFSSHNGRAINRLNFKRYESFVKTLKFFVISVLATLRSFKHLIVSPVFWKQKGYTYDRLQPLLTYYSTPKVLLKEVETCGFTPLQALSGEHPRSLRTFQSPWTYVAAIKPEHDQVVCQVEEFNEVLAHDWDRLGALHHHSVFQTRAWYQAWQAHFAPKSNLKVIVARKGERGEVLGMLPLVLQERALHRFIKLPMQYFGLAGAGVGSADHMGPIAMDWSIGYYLMRKALEITGGVSLYLENFTPQWSAIASVALPAETVVRTECPVNLRMSKGSFQDSWSAKMRKNVRRRSRQMQELGITFQWAEQEIEFERALQSLRNIHTDRWKAAGGSGLFDDRREKFLLDFARFSKSDQKPRILLMQQEGNVIGALLGFVHGRTFSVYKTGWSPDMAKLGVGIALGAEAMDWAEKNGFTAFDYLKGPRGHKRDLGCVPVTDESRLVSHGFSGMFLGIRERLSSGGVWSRRRSGL